ncbi:hypothetical protein F5141DRAFT_1200743 [Pisolithus sp. B1]|nr:hypothetical protein F5141DRAFT_1200743 [Pisolithus sp. B1]
MYNLKYDAFELHGAGKGEHCSGSIDRQTHNDNPTTYRRLLLITAYIFGVMLGAVTFSGNLGWIPGAHQYHCGKPVQDCCTSCVEEVLCNDRLYPKWPSIIGCIKRPLTLREQSGITPRAKAIP